MEPNHTMEPKTTPRPRNPRGTGDRLRDEILIAAEELLRDMPGEALTLRAVARAAGITAPSIYRHFIDREAIIRAVVDRAFDELERTLGADMISALEEKTGLSKQELLDRLSSTLPGAVDRFTPEGRLPTDTEAGRLV